MYFFPEVLDQSTSGISIKTMQKNSHSLLLIGVLSLFLLSGCSVLSVAYDYADWIMLWRIDHYFDTSPQQEEFLEKRVNQLHHWHRTHELPLYADFLRHIQHHVRTGLSPESLDEMLVEYQELRAHLAKKIAFHGTPFLINLKPAQQEYFRSVLQQENQDLQKDFGETPEDRVANRMKSTMSILEFWVGDLTEKQTATIHQFIQEFPDTTEAYIHYRNFRQKQLFDVLIQLNDPPVVEKNVAEWISSNGEDVPPEFYSGIQQWQKAVKDIILKIDQIINPEQRQYMVSKLQNLIDELHSLSRA